ncbi:rhamnosyl transferase [Streptococcus infantarius subsp. infantarius]|uniref:glycosyltransferase family 2 protein n=1 Tax=uncultured Streptococcus sp. TaxID=83427 RepID=UPI00208EAC04|nr:glycosyltransferase [uncultured Streptococcus sp.]MCO4488254.1 rhamnosyl transferase [Streptococcus infantarius subsp. infantarius]MCO4490316.1 rhamnosyl transferase [Streptococcus infantarius subsp. infantarius]MCO4492432.1 rhamnosyl transferase [Streptococcus infantarius subsp. infantarius]MCO4507179.1 rhamnosyl transferase [Streptococcus infantarius subsp. infantarius]MCO4509511.1 rhamnosyl transferase [Streptococcus infantarius subsp. infantarius]
MKVSIICTNYNKEAWIEEAIKGFLNQKCDFDYEIILVDDASSDHSPQIIERYANQYPDKIKAVFHQENLGITKTWLDICQLAQGDYIARCDGDDYWIDVYKLQKQVDILERSTASKWSCSDFNIISESGELRQKKAIENGIIRKISSFEEMLAFRGMTMSSTWLVDRNLMLEVNDAISPDAVDDTFSLQLELFTRTELTFLPEATTVYRLHEGSDSHPVSVEKLSERFEKLQETQEEYLEKYYSKIDFKVLTRYLFSENTEREKIIARRQQELTTQLNNAQVILDELLEERAKLKSTEEKLESQIAEKNYWLNEYNKVIHSKRWVIPTKIINLFRRNR